MNKWISWICVFNCIHIGLALDHNITPANVEKYLPDIIEFFSYDQKSQLAHKKLSTWLSQHARISFESIPIFFNEKQRKFAQLFFTCKMLGLSEKFFEPMLQYARTHTQPRKVSSLTFLVDISR